MGVGQPWIPLTWEAPMGIDLGTKGAGSVPEVQAGEPCSAAKSAHHHVTLDASGGGQPALAVGYAAVQEGLGTGHASLGKEMSKRSTTLNNSKQVPPVAAKDPTVPKGAWYGPAWVWGDGPTGAWAQRPDCVSGKQAGGRVQAVSGRAGAMGRAEWVGVSLATPSWYRNGDSRDRAWDRWCWKDGDPLALAPFLGCPLALSPPALLPPVSASPKISSSGDGEGGAGGHPWVQPCQPRCPQECRGHTLVGVQVWGSLCSPPFAGLL